MLQLHSVPSLLTQLGDFRCSRLPNLAYHFQQELSNNWGGRPFGHNRHGLKVGVCCAPFRGVSWVPIWHNVAWAEAYFRTKWHFHTSRCLTTIDRGRKLGAAVPYLIGGGLGPHLTQCRLGRGLTLYQAVSWSTQPFGQNRHGSKVIREGSCCNPFGRRELGPNLTQCRLGRDLPP